MTKVKSRLSLGTANWGQPYGLAGTETQVDAPTARAIIDAARELGITRIDTAISYGGAEDLLGELGVADFEVTTKLPGLPDNVREVESWVRSHIEGSLSRLGIERLACVLLHRPDQLNGARGDEFMQALLHLREQTMAEQIGLSVYDPGELSNLEVRHYLKHLDRVQGPMSVLDQRFRTTGWLARLFESGVAFEARSVFLKGALALPRGEIPFELVKYQQTLHDWWQFVDQLKSEPATVAISAVLNEAHVEGVVVGSTNPTQLRQLGESAAHIAFDSVPNFGAPIEMIDPRLWHETSSP